MNESLTVLGFFEAPEEDQPPVEIWGNDERLTEWWEGVKWRRANPRSPDEEPIEDQERNELLRTLGLG